jgi:hypothetical protein
MWFSVKLAQMILICQKIWLHSRAKNKNLLIIITSQTLNETSQE